MTNVSKNMLFAFLVLVSATVFSLGAFATTVHADDYGFSVDGGGYSDFSSYDGGYSDYSSYGGYSDYSDYGGDYSDYSAWSDSYNPGYVLTDSYNPGYYETDSYNPGYYDTDSYNPGYYDTDSYNPGYYETDSYNPGYYDTDSYSAGYIDQYMEQYAASNGYTSGGSYGGGSFGGGSYGGGFSMPKFTTGGCTTCHTQSYPVPVPTPTCTRNCYPTPTPTPTCTTCGGGSTSNWYYNSNTNTWIDNSINGSFNTNVTTLAPVIAQPIVQYQYQQQIAAPYCVITLTNTGAYNTQATLVWSSSNATTGYISSIGSVAPNGTRYVTGYANQVYSLTVTGQGGTYTCQTQPFTPTYVPPTPIYPSVSLTQIPYTGLALGPVAQALYWLSLFAVAAAGGYLLVYYLPRQMGMAGKGGALAFAGASLSMKRRNHIVVSEQEAEEVVTPVVEETEEVVTTPVSNVFNFLPTMGETNTRDAMKMIRNANGMPQIVISRA